MKKTNYKPLAGLLSLLLLTLCVTDVCAQEAAGQKPSGERGPRRRPDGAVRESDSRIVREGIALQPRNSVRVEIRYNKEFGYQSRAVGGPTSCEAFLVSFNWDRDLPIRAAENEQCKMRESNGYYVCDFLIPELPLNKKITFSAELSKGHSTEVWHGGSQSQPPSGERRVIADETRTVTLTQSEPRALLSFEMAYQQPRSIERPRFKIPPMQKP